MMQVWALSRLPLLPPLDLQEDTTPPKDQNINPIMSNDLLATKNMEDFQVEQKHIGNGKRRWMRRKLKRNTGECEMLRRENSPGRERMVMTITISISKFSVSE